MLEHAHSLILDAVLGSIIPLINFILLLGVVIRLQVMRRQIKSAEKLLEERAIIFDNIFKHINEIRDVIQACELHQWDKKAK